jgi:hypothetical protein
MLKLVEQVAYWSVAIACVLVGDKAKRLADGIAVRLATAPIPKYTGMPPQFGWRSAGR